MHPVLKNAIDNPRFARPYGSDKSDHGWPEGIMTADRFIVRNSSHMYHDNDNSQGMMGFMQRRKRFFTINYDQ